MKKILGILILCLVCCGFTFNSDENWNCQTEESTQYSDTILGVIEEETNNTSTSLTNKISEYSSKITEGVNNASEKINTIKV